MRLLIAVFTLCVIVATGASRTLPVVPVAAFSLQQAEAAAPATSSPLGGEPRMGATEIDLVKFGFTQGGLTLVLIVVLLSYRRDFFRKNEAKQDEIDALREDKRALRDVLERNATAMTQQAVAVLGNTEATKLLAQNVNNLAERRHVDR